jgi:hypothetical protein
MKRPSKPAKKTRKHPRRKRTKNPAFKYADLFIPSGDAGPIDIDTPGFDGMTGFAADLMIRSALLNATDTEKLIIAGMVPIMLKFIRGAKSVPAEATETPPGRTEETRNEVPNPDEAKL